MILLVEDNELNRDMLSRCLERRGYEIKMAVDGGQGVRMAAELRPALILMDLSLPVMDGWEAIRRLKGNPETTAIPIIALTAHGRAEDEKPAREAGAEDFNTEPTHLNCVVRNRGQMLTIHATGTIPHRCGREPTRTPDLVLLPKRKFHRFPLIVVAVARRIANHQPSEKNGSGRRKITRFRSDLRMKVRSPGVRSLGQGRQKLTSSTFSCTWSPEKRGLRTV